MQKIFRSVPLLVAGLLLLLTTNACIAQTYDVASNSKPVTHETWDALLKKHVSAKGGVDYQGFILDSVKLNSYLKLLSDNHPNAKNWSRNEQLAYWINAYNAFTVKLVIKHYPVKSIKDIKKGVPFVNTVWDIKFIKIEGATYDLNNIEHSIIRPKFKDPRIHFAVNCASGSCPNLLNEAFTAKRLDEQLDKVARSFLADKSKNKIASASKAELSKIFSWYKGDFTEKGQTLVGFINKYAPLKLDDKAELSYLDYDWSLNEEKKK